MGFVETIPGTVSAPTGKLLYNDPIMSGGSLLLFDPTHSLGAFSGMPVDGAVLPNIAWDIAANILGAGNATTLGALAYKAAPTAGASIMERSGKGGLHGLYSTVTTGVAASQDNYLGIKLPPALRDYVWANLDHAFFVSVWMRVTRPEVASAAPQAPAYLAQSTAAYLFHTQSGNVSPMSGAARLGRRSASPILTAVASGQPVFMNVGVNGFTGTAPGTAPGVFFASGAHGPWANYNRPNPLGAILERAYVEDLTVSGRTYAQVDAIDTALQAAAHAAGGRWYGDTYTDPSTFP